MSLVLANIGTFAKTIEKALDREHFPLRGAEPIRPRVRTTLSCVGSSRRGLIGRVSLRGTGPIRPRVRTTLGCAG